MEICSKNNILICFVGQVVMILAINENIAKFIIGRFKLVTACHRLNIIGQALFTPLKLRSEGLASATLARWPMCHEPGSTASQSGWLSPRYVPGGYFGVVIL